jgi:hypothetical protein
MSAMAPKKQQQPPHLLFKGGSHIPVLSHPIKGQAFPTAPSVVTNTTSVTKSAQQLQHLMDI